MGACPGAHAGVPPPRVLLPLTSRSAGMLLPPAAAARLGARPLPAPPSAFCSDSVRGRPGVRRRGERRRKDGQGCMATCPRPRQPMPPTALPLLTMPQCARLPSFTCLYPAHLPILLPRHPLLASRPPLHACPASFPPPHALLFPAHPQVIAELIAELHASVEMSQGFEGEMKSLVDYARSAAAPGWRHAVVHPGRDAAGRSRTLRRAARRRAGPSPQARRPAQNPAR